MSLKTLYKRLATIEDSECKRLVTQFIDELETVLSIDEIEHFYKVWQTPPHKRAPEDNALFEQAISNRAVGPVSHRFLLACGAADLRKLHRINRVRLDIWDAV